MEPVFLALCLYLGGILIWRSSVDFRRSDFPHLVCDMSVNIQSCCGRDMTDNGGESLDVHAVFQRCGGESVSQIMKSDTLTVCPLQYGGQPLADSSGISGRVIVQREGTSM